MSSTLFHLMSVTDHHIKMVDPGQHNVMGTSLIIPTRIYSKLCLTLTVKWPSAAAGCISNSERGCANEMLVLVTKARRWLLLQIKAGHISCQLSSLPFICTWVTHWVKKQAVGVAGFASVWSCVFWSFLTHCILSLNTKCNVYEWCSAMYCLVYRLALL